MFVTALSLCNREEWEWLQSHVYTTVNGSAQNLLSGEDESLMESKGLVEFVRSLRAAITHLLTKLNIPLYRVKKCFKKDNCVFICLKIRSEFVLSELLSYFSSCI